MAKVLNDGKFQVMPALLEEQFEALKADIAARGVLTPIDVDEDGRVLDGHHRLRACEELGIGDFPVFVRTGLASDVDKRTYARQANSLRRHQTRAQLRDLIAAQLRDTPSWADARVARTLGTSDKTVRAVRRRLEATSEIPRLRTFEGTDGRARPSTQPDRSTFVDDWGGLSWEELQRIAALPPDQRVRAYKERGIPVMTTAWDPFAGCSQEAVREWLTFELFLIRCCGLSVAGAARHGEWIRERPFDRVDEWLGDAGAAWRRSVGLRAMPASLLDRWATFAAGLRDRTVQELDDELCALPGGLPHRVVAPGANG